MGVGKGKKKVNPMEYQPLCDTTSSVGLWAGVGVYGLWITHTDADTQQ